MITGREKLVVLNQNYDRMCPCQQALYARINIICLTFPLLHGDYSLASKLFGIH